MKLVIIGNGFDSAHKLKTSYRAFKTYLKKNDLEEYKFLAKVFGKEFYCEEFWWNFESSLSNIKFENLCKSLKTRYKKMKSKGYSDNRIESILKEENIKNINKIQLLFCRWINEVNNNYLPLVHTKETVKEYLTNSIVLSFNYTSLIEDCYSLSDCFHIHGYIKNVNVDLNKNVDDIILGHRFDMSFIYGDKELSANDAKSTREDGTILYLDGASLVYENEWCDNAIVNNVVNCIYTKYEEYYVKRSRKIIREDNIGFFSKLFDVAEIISDVFVLGHSLSEIDSQYFERIIEIFKTKNVNPNWYISYYNNSKKSENNKKELTENFRKFSDNYFEFITI